MITFGTLFSGSSGNATYIEVDDEAILIDCGMSGKQIFASMDSVGLCPSKIRAILITHEHSDHIKGAGVLSRKLDIPIYATRGTWEGMFIGDIAPKNQVLIGRDESFFFNRMELMPIPIPHDANDPVAYRLFAGGHSVAVATDLGHFSSAMLDALSGSDVVLLESNHDPDMLQDNAHYPVSLKRRILGNKGHLSNESGAKAALRLLERGTKHLLLGHLSGENNTPELAYKTTHQAFTQSGVMVGQDVQLHVASRSHASHFYQLT